LNLTFSPRFRSRLFTGIFLAFTSGALITCATAQTGSYEQTNIISNVLHDAERTQRSLSAPWGLAISPGTGFVIVNNGSGTFETYDASGDTVGLAALVAGPPQLESNPGPSAVTANTTGGFFTQHGKGLLPSPFLFATLDGTISGQYADTNGDILETTVLGVDHSAQGAVYTGLAILTPNCCAPFLAVANFKDAFIETYTDSFAPLGVPGAFIDTKLPAGYAPFNIQVIGGQVFVTYALQNATKNGPVVGPGNGIVDIYELDGSFVKRFVSQAQLNAPWGVAKASADFGPFSNDILIANFGDGAINAFNPITGAFAGQIKNAAGGAIVNPGLRGLVFGASGTGDPNTLYFTSGVPGLPTFFGAISAISAK
jgi:uncharacterized protein (TIGR03118 family)